MKRYLLFVLFLVLVGAATVFAAWTDDFLDDFKKLGITLAVENALDNDITPQKILTYIFSNEYINEKATLKALYCAGVDPDTVQDAALKLSVSEDELARALEESIAECGTTMVLDDRDNSGINASPSRPAPLPFPPDPQSTVPPPVETASPTKP